MLDLIKMREAIQQRTIKDDPVLSGKEGERLAVECCEKVGISLCTVNQMPDTFPEELKSYGGKRPDFIVDTDMQKLVAVIDAKYHQTNDLEDFTLQNEELDKYSGLKTFLKDLSGEVEVWVIFMVFPKEASGQSYTVIELEEMLLGEDSTLAGKPAKKVTLEGKLMKFGSEQLAK
ncbi:hypothetical protein H4F17_09190 [Vibrio cholerae]